MENIVLIGMPGSGKSTVGVLLAKSLGLPFIDTDLIIQEKQNRFLQDIINEDGIKRFLEIEENTILGMQVKNSVVATGGSVVYSIPAMQHLKHGGTVVYLQLECDELEKRLKNIKTRGIAMEKGQTLLDLYRERIPLYEKYADIVVDCQKKEMEEVVSDIKQKVSCT